MIKWLLVFTLSILFQIGFSAHAHSAQGGAAPGKSADVRKDGAHRQDAAARTHNEGRGSEHRADPNEKGNETSRAARAKHDEKDGKAQGEGQNKDQTGRDSDQDRDRDRDRDRDDDPDDD